MPTNQQRREAERRRLQRQLEDRRAREAQRKRFTLIGSVIGTLVVIGAVVGIVLATTGGNGKGGTKSGGEPDTVSSPASSPTTSAATTAPPAAALPTAPCAGAPKTGTAAFQGVTISGATDLKHAPTVKSQSAKTPTTLQCEDLVIGTGKTATSTSTVSVQYVGALYKDGKQFDSSWSRGGTPASFSLAPGSVIDGFSQGIGGAGKVAPMREGGRRLMILPASLAYGASPPSGSGIPPNAPLIFIVDLKTVS